MNLQPLLTSRDRVRMAGLTCLATAVASCSSGGAPELRGLEDQVAQVGTELQIDLSGTDPDGDELSYGFHAAALPDLSTRAQINVSPSGAGVFRWTPLGSDVGEHAFDFTVSDGDSTTTVTITIDVRSAIGAATAPIFREPLGTGTTLDVSERPCLDLDVVIEDQDTAQVTLSQEAPMIEGAMLVQKDGQTATWTWCPTREQEVESRYMLVLGADDGDNPMTLKNYLIVLRTGPGPACPGAAPVIVHTPQNVTSIVDLTVDARITDDMGVKEAPLFYYSDSPPADPPNLASMIQLTMLKIEGSPTDATYAADVPNPVANAPAGTKATLYYVVVADDDDDTTGSCDHTTISKVYQMTVTSNGSADQPVCATCTADAQCGSGDLCVVLGAQGDSRCMQSCDGGCPSGYTCSADPVYSVDGTSAKQCIPLSGSCEPPVEVCIDDDSEDDDTRAHASANGPIAPGSYDRVSCPKAIQPPSGSKVDDDWFQIKVDVDTKLDLWLYGNGPADLDLTLYRSNETVLSKSTSMSADENIVRCVTPGTYYVKVNGPDPVRSTYWLEYSATPQMCSTTCTDDGYEDDDTYSQARPTTSPVHSASNNRMCPNDDDWYHVRLFDQDKLTIDTVSIEDGDIDLHLYKGFTDLWPCSPANPGECSAAHGQTGTPSEHAEHVVTNGCANGCDFYVVVRGYGSVQNDNYSITIKVE